MFATVIGFPLTCLGVLIWMSHLEDSLPSSVRRAGRTPDPAPILAIPVSGGELGLPEPFAEPDVSEEPVHLPVQRSAPLPEPAVELLEPVVEPLADPAPG